MLAHQRIVLDVVVPGEPTDRRASSPASRTYERSRESTDVDQHRRRRQPQLHQRQQRVAAGEELGVVAVLGEQRDRVVERVGAGVGERGGDHRLARHLRRAGEHRGDDVVVAGAAAEVALEALAHLGFVERRHPPGPATPRPSPCRACSSRTAGRGARGTRPASGAASSPSASPSMVVTDAAVGLRREHGARLHRLAVEQHGARAARRGIAADVGAGEADDLAQVLHEQRTGLDLVLGGCAVDRDVHPDGGVRGRHAGDTTRRPARPRRTPYVDQATRVSSTATSSEWLGPPWYTPLSGATSV